MSRTQYLDLDDRTEDVREVMRERPRETQDFLEKYELSWIYHECALEGMVLTHAELRQALEPNPGMVDSSMVHAFSEVRNQRVAIDFIKQEAKARQLKYNLTLVKKLYEILTATCRTGCRSRSGATCRCTGRTSTTSSSRCRSS